MYTGMEKLNKCKVNSGAKFLTIEVQISKGRLKMTQVVKYY